MDNRTISIHCGDITTTETQEQILHSRETDTIQSILKTVRFLKESGERNKHNDRQIIINGINKFYNHLLENPEFIITPFTFIKPLDNSIYTVYAEFTGFTNEEIVNYYKSSVPHHDKKLIDFNILSVYEKMLRFGKGVYDTHLNTPMDIITAEAVDKSCRYKTLRHEIFTKMAPMNNFNTYLNTMDLYIVLNNVYNLLFCALDVYTDLVIPMEHLLDANIMESNRIHINNAFQALANDILNQYEFEYIDGGISSTFELQVVSFEFDGVKHFAYDINITDINFDVR